MDVYDKNGDRLRVGDDVSFFGEKQEGPWYVGKIIAFYKEKQTRIVHIARNNNEQDIWRRFSNDVEKAIKK
jgi:hypothetical protein